MTISPSQPPQETPSQPTHDTTSGATPARITLLLQVVAAVLVLTALVVMAPFAPALTLAAWFAMSTRSWLDRLARGLGGRTRAAAVLTVSLFVTVVGPLVTLVFSLVLEARGLITQLAKSGSGRRALDALVSPNGDGAQLDWHHLWAMLQTHGEQAWQLVGSLASVTTDIALGVFVFFSAAYVMLVDGPRGFSWFVRNTPIDEKHLRRFSEAFQETGRGLFVGVAVTGLIQASIATITYLLLGVPRAILLGTVTLVASLVPSVGTALVWFPVSVGLLLSGRTSRGVILLAVGMLVISTVDNLLRPVLARRAHLDMHGFMVMLSMLGGLAMMGAWGLMFGPLIVRLAIEALRILREARRD